MSKRHHSTILLPNLQFLHSFRRKQEHKETITWEYGCINSFSIAVMKHQGNCTEGRIDLVCESREIRICHSGEAWKQVNWSRKLQEVPKSYLY